MKDNKNSVFETFLTFIRKERGYSSNTIDAYKRDIDKFNLFLIKYFDSDSIDYKMVDKWTLRNFFGKEEEDGVSSPWEFHPGQNCVLQTPVGGNDINYHKFLGGGKTIWKFKFDKANGQNATLSSPGPKGFVDGYYDVCDGLHDFPKRFLRPFVDLVFDVF